VLNPKDIENIIECKPLAIENVLKKVYDKIKIMKRDANNNENTGNNSSSSFPKIQTSSKSLNQVNNGEIKIKKM
jgi:hypothetical protein